MSVQRDAWGERLPRHLGLGSAVAVLVGSTIGSGIFRVPAGVAETAARAGTGAARLGRGRAGRAVRRPHLCRAGGGDAAVGRRVRLHPRGLRPASGVSVRLVRAHRHPGVRARRHRYDLRRVPGLLHPSRSGAGALGGRGGHLRHGRAQLRGREQRGGGDEPDDDRQVRRAGRPGAARVHGRQHRSLPLHAGLAGRSRPVAHRDRADHDHVDVRRLGRPVVHGWRGEGPGADAAAGAHPRHVGDRARLSAAQRRLHLPGAVARDGGCQADRRHGGGPDPDVRRARAERWCRAS